MNDFTPNEPESLSAALAGKTISKVEVDRETMYDHLVLRFTDGTVFRLRYDYIYDWDLESKPQDKA